MASIFLSSSYPSSILATPSLRRLPSLKTFRRVNIVSGNFPKKSTTCSSVSSPSISSTDQLQNEESQKPVKDMSSSLDATQNQFLQQEIEDTSFNATPNQFIQEEERPLEDMWMEIQGCNDWEGLIDPMKPTLRGEIIRYGEFSQACYDAFDFDPHSKYCGTCKYHGTDFFENLDMTGHGYKVTRYLYATSDINLPNFFQKSKMSSVWSTHANWMGYVAVATNEEEIKRLGRRDIIVAWRGTVTYLEWIHDLKDILHPACFRGDTSIKIESGFFDLYTKKEQECDYCSFSAREQTLAEIKRLVERYKSEKISITFTGHSLGAALALLSAYDVAEMGLNVQHESDQNIPITVFSFSGPRVGNLKFKERCDELGVKVLRVTNLHDKVPNLPGLIANEKFQFQKYIEDTISFPWSYAHVGTALVLDHKESPFLQSTNDLRCLHNLEALLHLVDGYQGKGKEFSLATERDIALVNKDCGFLKKEYDVPPHWRQDHNKGMVRHLDGRWVVPERRLDPHPPDTAHYIEQVLKSVKNTIESMQE